MLPVYLAFVWNSSSKIDVSSAETLKRHSPPPPRKEHFVLRAGVSTLLMTLSGPSSVIMRAAIFELDKSD